jgi:hypothetical protein
MIRLARDFALGATGIMGAIWIAFLIVSGGPRSAGEWVLLVWAAAGLTGAILSPFVAKPRAVTLGAAGERTP